MRHERGLRDDIAARELETRGKRKFAKCSEREFCSEPTEVLEKVLVEEADVVVCSIDWEKFVRGTGGRPRPIAALIPAERYEYFLQLEARIAAAGELVAEANV